MASPSNVATATAIRNVRINVKLFSSLNGARRIPSNEPRLIMRTATMALIQAVERIIRKVEKSDELQTSLWPKRFTRRILNVTMSA